MQEKRKREAEASSMHACRCIQHRECIEHRDLATGALLLL
jgi:hypothetical protein